MKEGDLVRLKEYPKETGIVIRYLVRLNHYDQLRHWVDILMHNGVIQSNRNPSDYEVVCESALQSS